MERLATLAATLTAAVCFAAAAAAQPAASTALTVYPASDFAEAQPETALDMILRLPGFSFEAGDPEVRGLVGAAGNVLVDGRRLATKQDDLETVLRRIPASAVAEIQLLRPGAGVDMQGRALVANVVRRTRAEARGRLEAGLGLSSGAGAAPAAAAEVSRRSGSRLIEASAAVRREVDDDKGEGPRRRMSPSGVLVRDASYREDKWTEVADLTGAYEGKLLGGALRLDAGVLKERTRADILERVAYPTQTDETVREAEDAARREYGLQYRRALAAEWKLEVTGLSRRSRSDAEDISLEADERSLAAQSRQASEDAARLVVRRGGRVQWETGAEWALNTLSSRSALTDNGAAVALPFARITLEEQRRELFAGAVWRASPALTVELGLTYEASRLVQGGDARLDKALAYLKPRTFAGWRPTDRDELSLEVERRVGQLDFDDFVTSASLTSGTVTSGNPDLEPEQLWRATLSWRRRLGAKGSLLLTARHDQIQSAVDRVPILLDDEVFDAPGNIGRGRRDEAQATLTLPLDSVLTGGLLKADLLWRTSQVRDPATGQRRPISGESGFVGAVHLSQDFPKRGLAWGADVALASRKAAYLPQEVKFDETAARLDLHAEYRPKPGWLLRLDLRNLNNGEVARRRLKYAGIRGAGAPAGVETRSLRAGPSMLLTLQRSFPRQ